MTLEDYETRRDIVNPYITLYSPEDCWVALNTETFRDAQRELLHPNSESIYMRLKYDDKKRLYSVTATVGKQDHPFDWEQRNIWTRGVRANGASDAVALAPIGYLLEDVVKNLFPKSFAFFEDCRMNQQDKE